MSIFNSKVLQIITVILWVRFTPQEDTNKRHIFVNSERVKSELIEGTSCNFFLLTLFIVTLGSTDFFPNNRIFRYKHTVMFHLFIPSGHIIMIT